jgi:hypothetical protein
VSFAEHQESIYQLIQLVMIRIAKNQEANFKAIAIVRLQKVSHLDPSITY